jgi:hypothetical protein
VSTVQGVEGARGSFSVAGALSDGGLRLPLTYFVAGQLLDSLTTIAGLLSGLEELNPVTAAVLHRFGEWGLLLQKVPVVIVVLLCVSILPRRLAFWATWMCTGVMAAVIASNATMVLSTRH